MRLIVRRSLRCGTGSPLGQRLRPPMLRQRDKHLTRRLQVEVIERDGNSAGSYRLARAMTPASAGGAGSWAGTAVRREAKTRSAGRDLDHVVFVRPPAIVADSALVAVTAKAESRPVLAASGPSVAEQ